MKFGFDLNQMYSITTRPLRQRHVQWRRHGAQRRAFAEYLQPVRAIPLGAAIGPRTAQGMTPLLSTEGAKSAELPATVRSESYGVYIRDQWQLNRKMTASVGMRWEYCPFSPAQRAWVSKSSTSTRI